MHPWGLRGGGSGDLRSHHVTRLASKCPRSKLCQTAGSVTQPLEPRTKSSWCWVIFLVFLFSRPRWEVSPWFLAVFESTVEYTLATSSPQNRWEITYIWQLSIAQLCNKSPPPNANSNQPAGVSALERNTSKIPKPISAVQPRRIIGS